MKRTGQEETNKSSCLESVFYVLKRKTVLVRKKFSLRMLLVYSFLMLTFVTWGQKAELKKADALYVRGEYYEALKLYNQVKDLGQTFDLKTQIKVGHCYYNLNNIDTAFEIFYELNEQGKLSGYDLFIYALSAHKFGFYSEAIERYQQVRPQLPDKQSQIDEFIRACEWAEDNKTFDPDRVRVNPSTLLTFGQSFGIQYYDKGVVYSSASEDPAPKKSKKEQIDKQGMNFLNLYYSDIDGATGEVTGKGHLFSKNLVFDFHVGAISFTPDNKYLYYTKTVRLKKGGESRLKIYIVTFNGRDWVNEQEISINSNTFDNAHPAVSPDGKLLYFVSNRPGGYGGKDLYVVERKPNGEYGSVRNLGPEVNTFGDEMYPYVSKDNILYFASDGHIGFGGLDLFKSEFVDGEWKNVENMMMPFNSNKDDFGYVINPDNPRFGFISTNRTGNGSNDVIFYVRYSEEEMLKKDEPTHSDDDEHLISGAQKGFPSSFITKLSSTFNNEIVSGATIVIKDAFTGNIVAQGVSDANGQISLVIPDQYKIKDQEFEITISKSGEFQPKTIISTISEISDFENNGISLTPIFKDKALNELSESIPYIGTEITAEGYKVLDKVAAYLLNNKHVVIKLNGHTECRGNKALNLSTSQSMAEKAEKYLIAKGVPSDNIIPRGYGERYLKNRCLRGKVCSEQEHLENRRIDVVVWRFK